MNGKGQAPSLHKLVEPSPAQEPPGRAAIPALQGPGSGRPDVLCPVSLAKGAPPEATRVARTALHYDPGRPRPLPTALAPMSARCKGKQSESPPPPSVPAPSGSAAAGGARASCSRAHPRVARSERSPQLSPASPVRVRPLPRAATRRGRLPPRTPALGPPQTPAALPRGSWRSRACV